MANQPWFLDGEKMYILVEEMAQYMISGTLKASRETLGHSPRAHNENGCGKRHFPTQISN